MRTTEGITATVRVRWITDMGEVENDSELRPDSSGSTTDMR